MKIYVASSMSISIFDYDGFEFIDEIYLGINSCKFYILNDYIYVYSETDGFLYVFDLKNNKIVDSILIGKAIKNILIYNEEIFLINEDSNSVYIIDVKNLMPIAVIGVDDMPHDFVIHNDKMYLTCMNSIVKIDTKTKSILKKKKFNFNPWYISFDKLKNEIYTSTLDGKLVILDDFMKVKSKKNKFTLPFEFKINHIYNKIYTIDTALNTIEVIDYDTKNFIKKINIYGYIQYIKLSDDYKYLFVCDKKNNIIKVYNCKDDSLVKEIYTKKEPTSILIV